MESALVNKVADSGIITLNLERYLPADADLMEFDLKPFLFKEMIVREKDFRQSLMELDWAIYKDKHIAVFCSVDAIIPMWAYMLVASALQPVAASVYYGTKEALKAHLMMRHLENISVEEYTDKRVVIKGCGDQSLPEMAFLNITAKLRPVVKSLMYGEPCSTVPVFKKK
jgi:hypothetical protein